MPWTRGNRACQTCFSRKWDGAKSGRTKCTFWSSRFYVLTNKRFLVLNRSLCCWICIVDLLSNFSGFMFKVAQGYAYQFYPNWYRYQQPPLSIRRSRHAKNNCVHPFLF
ncbi:unnamed protein product [Hymenolepis diminuta]|uniref:Uncharacterized protein n=1 Tax=Hymenolepis diminuta TaxID=6216 RepID=A0A564YRE5_HYMDI|nr:unnamed protein product [Hymenolepis diminuta]